MVVNKLEMEWELVKVRRMMPHKMLETKFSSRNRSWAIRMRRRTRTKMQEIKSRMILKWKEIFKEICTQRKNRKKEKKIKRGSSKKPTNKWVLWIRNRNKRIWKIKQDKPREVSRLMWMLRIKRRANNSWSIMSERRKKRGKGNSRDSRWMSRRKRIVIGTKTIRKEIKLINKRRMLKPRIQTRVLTWIWINSQRKWRAQKIQERKMSNKINRSKSLMKKVVQSKNKIKAKMNKIKMNK